MAVLCNESFHEKRYVFSWVSDVYCKSQAILKCTTSNYIVPNSRLWTMPQPCHTRKKKYKLMSTVNPANRLHCYSTHVLSPWLHSYQSPSRIVQFNCLQGCWLASSDWAKVGDRSASGIPLFCGWLNMSTCLFAGTVCVGRAI